MGHDERELEARLRTALRNEAGELWPPPTLWPRLQASLTRPAPGAPAMTRPRAEVRALLRHGDLRRLTLALLAEREMDAFVLAQRVEDVARGTDYPAPRDGTLLPVLHRLELEGLLDARWLSGPRGPRRAYTLSARGRRIRRRARLSWRLTAAWARLGQVIPHRAPRSDTT